VGVKAFEAGALLHYIGMHLKTPVNVFMQIYSRYSSSLGK